MTAMATGVISAMVGAADRINSLLERRFWLFGGILAFVLLACALTRDVTSRLWVDELYTLHMSKQPSAAEIWQATLEGSDGAAPLYAMLVRAIAPWVGSEGLAVRLPATLGYAGMVLCLLAFCRRLLPAVYALVAVMLACRATFAYASEGRGYGVVLCCAAGALMSWQAAAAGRRRALAIPLLGFCLAVMSATHYYAVFILAPLILAELTRRRATGKFDLAVLAAMAPALLVIGLHYPLIEAGKQFQAHHWSPARWGGIPEMYIRYLVALGMLPFGVWAVFSRMPERRNTGRESLTPAEWVATGAFALMPLCAAALSIYTTRVFVDRYMLWALTGAAVLVAALLCRAARGRTVIGVGLLGLLAVLMAYREAGELSQGPVLRSGEAIHRELATLADGSEPVVVADHHAFMELSYYAAPPMRERLVYPVSRELDLRFFGVDTGPLLMSALSRRTKLRIAGYDALLAAHPRFVLAARPWDYLPWHLVRAGYRVVPISSSDPPVLYEVEAPAR